MKKNTRLLLIAVLGFTFFYCTQNQDETTPQDNPKEETQKEGVSETATEATVEKDEVVSLLGAWKGKFDGRQTTFKITSQEGNTFKGKITINYRQQINQEVEGSFDTETLEFSMEDLLHSRYAGTYKGKLNKEYTNVSGTFTVKADGKKYKFNLTRTK